MSGGRQRSRSTNSPHSPTLLTRRFASLRLRRSSHSQPSSPPTMPSQEGALVAGSAQDVPSSCHPPMSPSPASADPSSLDSHDIRIRLVPNVGIASRCFVFEVVDRTLQPGVVVKIGRYSERISPPDRMSFRSKVVSRTHAELWAEGGKVYLRDIGSSSGTFVNRVRLSPPNTDSNRQEIKDGDLIQLGVDYQGGAEPMYRAVRMRLEVNREGPSMASPFSRSAFQQLRQHLLGTVPSTNLNLPSDVHATSTSKDLSPPAEGSNAPSVPTIKLEAARSFPSPLKSHDIQECCICLYAIAPFQALFIAPCSHIFHFKCLRPIVYQNYPGFSCPLCRGYSDLEASVAVEVSEVIEALGLDQHHEATNGNKHDITAISEEEIETSSVHSDLLEPSPPPPLRRLNDHGLSTTLVGSPVFEEILVASSGSLSPA